MFFKLIVNITFIRLNAKYDLTISCLSSDDITLLL